jgi:hypothetical protein
MRRQNNPLQSIDHWWHRWQLSTQKFAVVLTISAFLSGLGYVMLTNKTATEGFAIHKLQQELGDLKSQNEKLQLQTADLQSLAAADRVSQALDLQPVDSFEVLPTSGGAVARTP